MCDFSISKYVNLMFNIMRQMNTKSSELFLFQFTIYFGSVPFSIHKEKGTLPKYIHFLVYFCIHLSHNIEHKVNILANYI